MGGQRCSIRAGQALRTALSRMGWRQKALPATLFRGTLPPPVRPPAHQKYCLLPFISCPQNCRRCLVCTFDSDPIAMKGVVATLASAAAGPQGGWARSPATAAWGGS